MMNTELQTLKINLSSVVLYRNVLKDEVLQALMNFLQVQEDKGQCAEAYSEFVSVLYRNGGDLGAYLYEELRADDNVYVKAKASKKAIPSEMEAAFRHEMEIFTVLSKISPEMLISAAGLPDFFARFRNTSYNFTEIIPELLKEAPVRGYGIYARYGMFRLSEDHRIIPVLTPDPVKVEDLVGYELERGKVIENTRALVEGRPAANALLTGDAGTGKSSTVKACANMFRKDGLRLIELGKEELKYLSDVMAEIRENPLKFIIFIDDLSFAADDEHFGALKAVLEGSASAKADNAVIYATSNRRHMVRETFSSREGDEVHRNDTLEEQTSLAARFGLNVLFQKPNRSLYLTIVHTLAERKEIHLPENELDVQAEAFALQKGRRSARVAEQFTDSLLTAGTK